MLKRFLKYYKPHTKLFTLDMLASLLVCAGLIFYVTNLFKAACIPHPAEKKLELFRRQKELLDTFLSTGAISQAQHDKSLNCLIEKMGIK